MSQIGSLAGRAMPSNSPIVAGVGDVLAISVDNKGRRTPGHLRTNVLEPYVTTKAYSMGIGLACVKALAAKRDLKEPK
ncbi:MAG: hypothetical protein MK098_07490 [Marinovum sp.]|nr:hypothetical protein [Marinovum sp.]